MHLHRTILLCVTLTVATLGQQPYYPLAIGNRLNFSGNGPWSQIEISDDTVMTNGQTYAVLTVHMGYLSPFQRQAGSQILQFNSNTQSDSLLFDFSRNAGDTLALYSMGPSDTLDVILQQRDTVTLFGRRLRRWVFSYSYRHMIDGGHWLDVVDSVGITDITIASGFSSIVSAKIDGVTYSTVSVPRSGDPVPIGLQLHQNYPNPFNPTTRIRYSLPFEAVASLEVYDILGRMVRSFDLGYQATGDHETIIEPAGLASGVYLYRLAAGDLSQMRRFVLLR